MKLFPKLLLVFGLLSSCGAYAKFIPENDLYLQDNYSLVTGVDMDEMDRILGEIHNVYDPILSNFGYSLNVDVQWYNSDVNADVRMSGKTIMMRIFGGLARRPEMTSDAMSLVVCHEIGHVLGGIPTYSDRVSANEGQSDYYATLACSRNLWLGKSLTEPEELDSFVKTNCDKQHRTRAAQLTCYKGMDAGLHLAKLLSFGGQVSYTTPDKNVVSRTQDSHPQAQCRLDTYVAGALCQKSWQNSSIPKERIEQAQFSCLYNDNYLTGMRPTCWFKR